MKKLKEKLKVSCRRICEALQIPYSSAMRWHVRDLRNMHLVGRPGPKKTVQVDITAVKQEVALLQHRRKRTHGTNHLKDKYRLIISRREIEHMVQEARKEKNSRMRRIAWHTPGLAWAIDGASMSRISFQQMRDMASQYKFPPLAGACGEEIAGYIANAFETYGPPLFLKRDNGSNLNHTAVNDILTAYQVIPLNSPRRYPPYNGAIEHDQGELKRAVQNELALSLHCPGSHMPSYLKNAVNELNHKPRRGLGNHNSCRVFFDGKEKCKYTIRERKNIFEWLVERASLIIENMKDAGSRVLDAAWRIAVEQWLRIHGHITVRVNGKVLPNLSLIFSH